MPNVTAMTVKNEEMAQRYIYSRGIHEVTFIEHKGLPGSGQPFAHKVGKTDQNPNFTLKTLFPSKNSADRNA